MRSPWTLALRLVRNLTRWPWTRCAHCGLRLPFGYEPDERGAHHAVCAELLATRAALKIARERLARGIVTTTEAYAVIGGLCTTLHSRLSPVPGIGPVSRRDANVQMRRGYVWMQENAAAIDIVIRETDSGTTQQIKRVAAQYQREFQQHRQEVQ